MDIRVKPDFLPMAINFIGALTALAITISIIYFFIKLLNKISKC